jgi:hypothetical protein
VRLRAFVILATLLLTLPDAAFGSYLVTRNAAQPTLKVDPQGRALVSYRDGRKQKNLLVWNAVNALPPTQGQTQVAFRIDYTGGFKALKQRQYAKTIKNSCGRYDGPPLPLLVAACKAPDGSYWVLQRWQRLLPNLGIAPWKPEQSVQELHVSHWTGPLPVIEAQLNWSWSGKFRQVIGRYTYAGNPIYGFNVTRFGAPIDSWARNLYLDTHDSAYGAGWTRENSFLAQAPNGRFCYTLGPRDPATGGFPGYPKVGSRQGTGTRYRLTALGPGVTPIVSWEAPDPGAYDGADAAKVAAERAANALLQSLGFAPTDCHS